MKEKWMERIERLDKYLNALTNCNPIRRKDLLIVPAKGVYMFLENGHPVYIGRTNRMKGRLTEHGRQSSKHNDASFAFRIAKEAALASSLNVNFSRSVLCSMVDFQFYFDRAKERVRLMEIKYVAIDDQIDQALFEVYASEMFQTPYNDFDNH